MLFVVHQNRERQADNDLVGTPQRLATTWTRPQPKCFIYCNLTQIPRLQIAFGAKVQQAAGSVSASATASASVLVLVLVLWLCPSVSLCVCVCLQQADQTRPNTLGGWQCKLFAIWFCFSGVLCRLALWAAYGVLLAFEQNDYWSLNKKFPYNGATDWRPRARPRPRPTNRP